MAATSVASRMKNGVNELELQCKSGCIDIKSNATSAAGLLAQISSSQLVASLLAASYLYLLMLLFPRSLEEPSLVLLVSRGDPNVHPVYSSVQSAASEASHVSDDIEERSDEHGSLSAHFALRTI